MPEEPMDRKTLAAQYKERAQTGGVYMIRNERTGRISLDTAVDLIGSRNRFDFAKRTNSCVHMKLQQDWRSYGTEAFVYEELEKLKRKDDQSTKEFRGELELLKEIWIEKLGEQVLY